MWPRAKPPSRCTCEASGTSRSPSRRAKRHARRGTPPPARRRARAPAGARPDRRAPPRRRARDSDRPAAARPRGVFGRNSQRTRPLRRPLRAGCRAPSCRPARHVVLPADPGDRPAVPHQKAVAEVLGRRGIGHAHRAVEHAERDLAAPVGHVEQAAADCRGRDRPAAADRNRSGTRRDRRRSRGASARSVITACSGCAGSTAKRSVPAIFS